MKISPVLGLALLAGALLPACAELDDARTDKAWSPKGERQAACCEESEPGCKESATSCLPTPQTPEVSSQAIPTGDKATSALLMTKSLPATVQLEEPFSYTISIENLTSGPLSNVMVEERIPDSLTLLSSEPAMCCNENGSASWKLGTLEAGATREIMITGKAIADGLSASYALATYDSALMGQVNVVSPNLSLEMSAPESAMPGEPLEILLTVNNTGEGTAHDVRLWTILPEGLRGEGGADAFKASLESLAPGASHTMTISVTATGPGSFATTAEASMKKGEPVTITGAEIQVQDTRLELTAQGPSKFYLGQPGKITLTVKNVGASVAKEVKLEQPIPVGLELGRVSSPVEQVDNLLTWSLGDMEPGTESVITFYLIPTQTGTLELAASTKATLGSPAEASFSAAMEGISALHFTVEDLQDPVPVGESITYLIKVQNQGTALGANIEIVITMDEGMQLVHAKGPTDGRTEGNKIIFDALEALDPGATATWRLIVESQQVGDLRLGAALTSKRLRRPVEVTQSTQFYK